MYDLIKKKRDGGQLSPKEIAFFLEGFVAGEIPEYQVAALMMAVYFQGMEKEETMALVKGMIESGDQIDLSDIKGTIVDKHSTGGVGDKTSIVLTPLVASMGIPVGKLSGRGLGHTGGTLDKLESIPGFNTNLAIKEFKSLVKQHGIALTGQSANLVPADRKLYALRDVTATVENFSMIAGSIMSKKIAGGAQKIVLDVKCGRGAFMKNLEDATKLAELLVEIGDGMGRETVAIISNMNQPLGKAVGNALEVNEAVEALAGNGPGDLLELCLKLGAEMVSLANGTDVDEARKSLEARIEDGSAKETFNQWVKAQGGTSLDLQVGVLSEDVTAKQSGYIVGIDSEKVGIASMLTGAGRQVAGDSIDYGAGILLTKKIGDKVEAGEKIAGLFGNDANKLEEGTRQLSECFEIGEAKPEPFQLILGEVRK